MFIDWASPMLVISVWVTNQARAMMASVSRIICKTFSLDGWGGHKRKQVSSLQFLHRGEVDEQVCNRVAQPSGLG